MRRGGLAVLGFAAFAVAASAAPPPRHAPVHHAAAASRDWSRTVVATPEGGFRMGNPAAKVKLIEYGSLTCSHCDHFAREGVPALVAKYVRPGKVSYEYRNWVLNGLDASASLLARCAGPSGFFRIVDRLYATQDAWIKRAEAASAAEKARIAALPPAARTRRIAELAGLGRYAALGGVTPQRARACLSDPAGLQRLGQMYKDGSERFGVEGTPTFLINGKKIDVNVWPAVEPLIVQAGG